MIEHFIGNLEKGFQFKTEIDKTNYYKNLKYVGEVYAIRTKKGLAIVQIGGLDRHGIPICRVFSKLYKEIPSEINEILLEKESYLIIISVHSMAHWRVKQAIKIGKYELPKDFKVPCYYRECFSIGGKPASFRYWSILDYAGDIILLKDYIENVLNKKIKDNTWKADFLQLNSASIFNGKALIELLENDFSLNNWKPIDFEKKTMDILNER